jgi:hypothetical protein
MKAFNFDADYVRRWFGRYDDPWAAVKLFEGPVAAPFPSPPGVEKKKVQPPKQDYTKEHDMLRRFFSEEACSKMIGQIVASEASAHDDTLGPSIDACLYLYSKVRDDED